MDESTGFMFGIARYIMSAGGIKHDRSRNKFDDPKIKLETTKKFIFQFTAMIQLDAVHGPSYYPPFPPTPPVGPGVFQGDGVNRKFDDSNDIDVGSTRLNIIFEIIIKIVNEVIESINVIFIRKDCRDTHQLFPINAYKSNSLMLSCFQRIDPGFSLVSLSASSSNSLAPGSSLAPVRIRANIKFSPQGIYMGMMGAVSGFPWIQLRGFELGRNIDNLKFSPSQPYNPFLLIRTIEFKSGFWR